MQELCIQKLQLNDAKYNRRQSSLNGNRWDRRAYRITFRQSCDPRTKQNQNKTCKICQVCLSALKDDVHVLVQTSVFTITNCSGRGGSLNLPGSHIPAGFDMTQQYNADQQHVAADASPTQTCTITFPNIGHLSTSLSHARQHCMWHSTRGHISPKYDLRWLKAFWYKSVFSLAKCSERPSRKFNCLT